MSQPTDELTRTIEALIFLSPEPVTEREIAAACLVETDEIEAAIAALRESYLPGRRGIELRELAGGWTFASAPDTEEAARRLFSKPRTPPLSPAQAETLSIVAYLQPVSRPEITRIRGVSADSATGTLEGRGLIEEFGRSQFGAVLYRTTPLFLRLFGLRGLEDLPDVAAWDPTPEEEADLRERLLRAGEARSGVPTDGPGSSRIEGVSDPAGPVDAPDGPLGLGGELSAGGVDVPPTGEAHRAPDPMVVQD